MRPASPEDERQLASSNRALSSPAIIIIIITATTAVAIRDIDRIAFAISFQEPSIKCGNIVAPFECQRLEIIPVHPRHSLTYRKTPLLIISGGSRLVVVRRWGEEEKGGVPRARTQHNK